MAVGLQGQVPTVSHHQYLAHRIVTESKLVLLAARRANKLRDELLGQGIETLFGKPADREDGGLMSQRTVLPEQEFMLLSY